MRSKGKKMNNNLIENATMQDVFEWILANGGNLGMDTAGLLPENHAVCKH